MRERRRQRGLPLPIADKVLPFCAAVYDEPHDEDPAADASDCDTVNAPRQGPEARAESRVSEAWARLAAAEQAGSTRPVLEGLEEAYHAEVAAYRAALARESVCADFL